MDRRRLKFFLLGGGVALSMGFLLVVGMSRPGGFAYYLTVSEFMAQPDRHGDGFRINGKVAAGTIERASSGQDVRFLMTDGVQSLPVAYHGIIPDTFVDGADVVVEGALAPGGSFEAHTLLAKCPSKYESADGAEPVPPALAAGVGD
jgi:cytochrome c-type biogenesis protein CcmE